MSRSSKVLSHRERMVQYAPTPPLDQMNPIQRYLHKGALEPWDWARLALVVIAYLLLRPSIEWLMRKYFDADPFKTSQDARRAAKAKAKVSPNAIRGAVLEEEEEEDSLSSSNATTSGMETTANDDVSGRRGKGKSAFTAKTFEQQLLDWDDMQDIQPVEGPPGDVSEWVKKWDGDERPI